MPVAGQIDFLDKVIASQRITLRLQLALAILLVALGVTLVVLALVHPGLLLPVELKGGQTIGGVLLSTSSFIPAFSNRRERIAALQFVRHQYYLIQIQSPDAGDLKTLNERFSHLLDKDLAG
jgi:hypothetical protein